MFPMVVIFFISALAETNRLAVRPAGRRVRARGRLHVEYSSMAFALFFLGEYANMILMSGDDAVLFLGGWLAPFGVLAASP